MEPSTVFSVGHSNHRLEQLVERLRRHGVSQVADVRTYPGSRRMPWFNREALARDLPGVGVAYLHLPELGGRRRAAPDSPNHGWEVEGFRGYADHMAQAQFGEGLERLQDLAARSPTAMMCAEGLWWRCHRRLIADALVVREWRVDHIGPDGSLARHELTPFAVRDGLRLTYPPAQASLDSS